MVDRFPGGPECTGEYGVSGIFAETLFGGQGMKIADRIRSPSRAPFAGIRGFPPRQASVAREGGKGGAAGVRLDEYRVVNAKGAMMPVILSAKRRAWRRFCNAELL